MSEEKLISEWFGGLESPYLEQAMAQAMKTGTMFSVAYSLQQALAGGFSWKMSPQGEDYWKALYASLPVDGFVNATPSPWIKVSDRLPDLRKEFSWSHALVTAYAPSTGVFPAECSVYQDRDIVWYDLSSADSDGDCDRISDVTHWMPLPDPPKED